MEDDVAADTRRREELELIRAFTGIRDPGKRRRILELAEQLADEAASEATGLASTDAPPDDACRDAPGPTE
ncbi:hypothetical protein [Bradyrhizobium sp. YR681]|uniref:hypothetical protein n=1 Tax=Bradyrhizobium sp. YR681 TaxID=1144344 RepID=UPI001F0A5FCD|nr:hypothetical protein [Bradyrhizobium sp. YR681]